MTSQDDDGGTGAPKPDAPRTEPEPKAVPLSSDTADLDAPAEPPDLIEQSIAASGEASADLDASRGEPDSELPRMTVVEHLDELRRRLVYSLIGIFGGFGIGWAFSKPIFGLLAAPLTELLGPGEGLIFLRPAEPFILYMKVGLLAGIFIASPILLYQVWAFISPGLYKKEKNLALPFLFSTVVLFLAGGYFGYRVAYPAALEYLLDVGSEFRASITIDHYFALTSKIILGLGIVFEIPILIFFLSRFGIVSSKFLLQKFRYAVLIIAVLAALLTPTPDVVNMIVFMAPMTVLYLIGVGVAWLFEKPRDP